MPTRRIAVCAMLVVALLTLGLPVLTKPASALSIANAIADPGFESSTSSGWFPSEQHNGTASFHNNSTWHTGKWAAMLTAINTTAPCSSECRDTVSASIWQYQLLPTLGNLVSGTSLVAWWYIAPSSLPVYSLRIGVQFSNTKTIEYWYGHSNRTSQQYYLGPVPASGRWFNTSRDLRVDAQGLISDPSTVRISAIFFAAFGGSYQDCSPPTSCLSTPHGETVWLDDVALDSTVGPVAVFLSSPSSGSAPLSVTFNGGQSYELAGSPAVVTGYSWDFGDGTPNGTGKIASHTYSGPGTFTVTLTVTDSNGVLSVPSSQVIMVGSSTILVLLAAIGAGVGASLVGVYIFYRRRQGFSQAGKGKKAKGRV